VKVTTTRLAWAMAEELYKRKVAAVAVTPGFMRTEMVLDALGVSETNWRTIADTTPNFAHSETPFFVGRAVAALAGDPLVMRKTGGLYTSVGLAREYGFTDVDGSCPDVWPHVKSAVPASKTAITWQMRRSS
jgi:NAD(P)-dependent dehydrogenase (short-subunit alcohol dehydrogenase family)